MSFSLQEEGGWSVKGRGEGEGSMGEECRGEGEEGGGKGGRGGEHGGRV